MPLPPGSPPDPEDTATWPQFTERLRALYAWCGRPKYRALCGRCHGLSPAAVSGLIGRNPLTRPPETATERFVEACLLYRGWPDVEDETAKWTRRWKVLAGEAEDDTAGPAIVPVLRRRRLAASAIVAGGAAAGVAVIVIARRSAALNRNRRRNRRAPERTGPGEVPHSRERPRPPGSGARPATVPGRPPWKGRRDR